jgi:hypothetical protein
MSEQEVLTKIDAVFGKLPRPVQFVRNPKHCDECEEHEETLAKLTPETIGLNDVDSPAWDPMTSASDTCYQYFMPGLVRLALGKGEEYYLDRLLFHLDSGRIDAMDSAQKSALVDFLWFVYEANPEEVDSKHLGDVEWARVIDKLEGRWK